MRCEAVENPDLKAGPVACTNCLWRGIETQLDLRRSKGDIVERCPACGSEEHLADIIAKPRCKSVLN